VFGILAFVIAQVGMMVMGMMFPEMPESTGNMVMIVMGSVIGHYFIWNSRGLDHTS